MRFISAVLATVVSATALFSAADMVSAQDRLPSYVRSNSYVAGQVFGCAIRFDVYHRQTVDRAAAAGRTLPPTYQLNAICRSRRRGTDVRRTAGAGRAGH